MKIETIARKILAFDPGDDATFVAVGINEPMEPSTTGLTWNDIRALARAALPPGTKVSKNTKKGSTSKTHARLNYMNSSYNSQSKLIIKATIMGLL